MKKTCIVFIAIFFFSCGNRENTADDANRDDATIDESVEIGSGEEVSPQLDLESDTASLEVDTVTTPIDTNQRQP